MADKQKINVLIVDDEVLLRQGLRFMLEKEPFVKNILEAGDVDEFKAVINDTIDVILLDIRLRKTNGLELIKVVRDLGLNPKIIAVTGLDGVELIINLLKSGVQGIVYKLDGYDQILKAIKAAMGGDTYFPDNVMRIIQSNHKHWENTPSVILTVQEKELLKAIANGLTTKEMAGNFKMSEATAETYRIRLMKKVGVSNTAALMAYAYRNGIL
jgi:DNA-binding NarL/FixJ family response regulator